MHRHGQRVTRAAALGATALALFAAACTVATAAPAQCSGGPPPQAGAAGFGGAAAGALLDLTVPLRAGVPLFGRTDGLPRSWRARSQEIDQGDVVNQSHLNLDAHTGTHIVCFGGRAGGGRGGRSLLRGQGTGLKWDCRGEGSAATWQGAYARDGSRVAGARGGARRLRAARAARASRPMALAPAAACTCAHAQDAPVHFLKGGATIDQLPLSALAGHADVIDVAADANITGPLLAGLAIPDDARALLFRTQNTRRGLLAQTAFASDYVGLDASAAAWLAEERPGVALVGIDYVSIGALYDIEGAHKALFRAVRGGAGRGAGCRVLGGGLACAWGTGGAAAWSPGP